MIGIKKNVTLSSRSIRVINKLQERDQLERGLKYRDCKIEKYLDQAIELLREKEGIEIG